MTTLYQFPILKELEVSPQVAYEIIAAGVESLRVSYAINHCLEYDQIAYEVYDKIQQGERLLLFMRLNSVGPDVSKDIK